MSTAFTTRRRAEEFHDLIERASARELGDSRYAELAAVLTELRTAQREVVLPRADFATDLRSILMTAAATELVAPTPTPAVSRSRTTGRPRTRHERRIAAVFGGVALVTASASMAVAAQTALPGDTLYPLKRALENAHAGVQSGDGRGTTLLANASDRLQEVGELSDGAGGDDDPQVISQTLDDFSEQAEQASTVLLADYQHNGHVASLQKLQSFTRTSLAQLDTLAGLVPVESRGSLIAAASTLHRIEAKAAAVCPTCAVTVEGVATAATHLSPFKAMTQVAASVSRPVSTSGAPDPRTVVHRIASPPVAPTSLGHPAPAPSPASPAPADPLAPADTKPSSGQHGAGGGKGSDGGVLGGVTKPLTGGHSTGAGGLSKTVRDALQGTTDAIDQALTGHTGP